MPKRVILVVSGILALSTAVYVMALAGSEDDPAGYYASYELYPHSGLDVVEFRNGRATLRTCCGDGEFGT